MGSEKTLKEVPLGAVQAFSETADENIELYLPNKSATGRAVLYSGNDGTSTDIDYRRLQDVGVQTMLIAVDDLASCEETLERELSNLMLDPTVEPQKKALCAQQVGVNVARDMLGGGNPAADLDRASDLFNSLLTGMMQDPAVATSLLSMSAHHRTTASHLFAVSVLSMMLAQEAFGGDEQQMHDVALAGMLHDLGKTSVDADILSKTDPLTADEINLIRQHPVESIRLLGSDADVDVNICRMILEHHERYDGMGYPVGVAGEDISLGGRILAITDSFHAMIGRRDYRKALNTGRSDARHAQRRSESSSIRAYLLHGSACWPVAWLRKCEADATATTRPTKSAAAITPIIANRRRSRPLRETIGAQKFNGGQLHMACIATGTLQRAIASRVNWLDYPVVDLSRAGACLESIWGRCIAAKL